MTFVELGSLPVGAAFNDGHDIGTIDRHGRGMVHTTNMEGGATRVLSPTRLVMTHETKEEQWS